MQREVMRAVRGALFCAMAVMFGWSAAARGLDTEPTIRVRVDASDIARQLVRSAMTIRVEGRSLREGRLLDLHYVMWTPGNHGQSGPVRNVVDLRFEDCGGNALRWERDATQPGLITVEVPRGCGTIGVSMGYIASQPLTLSRSSDTYGRPNFGGLNWNTVLWYPGGMTHQEISVEGELVLPDAWRAATSLVSDGDEARRVHRYGRTTLAEYVDSPVIFGEHLVTTPLEVEGVPPHFFHTVASERRFAEVPDWLADQLRAMVREGVALFGSFPRRWFHFQYMLDDTLRFGLEHAESTYMADRQRRILGAEREEGVLGGGGTMSVVPHEYFHVWCGKLRAPEGMVRSDFHTPTNTELLWVYEGLTSYYDEVLSARSGMTTLEEFRQNVLNLIVRYEHRAGRLWRSIADTARHAGDLRDTSPSWTELRRGQDYYGEGSLFWLEADAIIRNGTGNGRSLDDFCRVFFDVPAEPVGAISTYSRADVVEALTAVYAEEDWDALIRTRIEEPRDTLELTYLVDRIGCRVEEASEPTRLQKKRASSAEGIDVRRSIGLQLDKDGKVVEITPGSAADEARLGFGMRVVAVDGWVYSAERLERAVKESVERGEIGLLVTFGERIESRRIAYSGGAKHPRLVPVEGTLDVLAEAAEPLVSP